MEARVNESVGSDGLGRDRDGSIVYTAREPRPRPRLSSPVLQGSEAGRHNGPVLTGCVN